MPESKQFEYEIGGKVYTQRPLVFNQIAQLAELLKDLTLPKTINPLTVAAALGERVMDALAIALIPEGETPEAKDNAAIAAALRRDADAVTIMQGIDDFFVCNRVSLLIELVGRVMKHLGEADEIASRIMSPSSPKETPSGAGRSGGPARPKTPSPMPGT